MKLFSSLILLTFSCMLLASGCNASNEIEVSIEKDPLSHWGGSRVVIQAVEDSVTVKNIVLNRGNCVVNYSYDYGTKSFAKQKILKYGEAFTPSTLCKPGILREVEVTTSNGTYKYKL